MGTSGGAALAVALGGAALTVSLLLVLLPARGDDISGSARVGDGDTIVLGATRVRLWGIDAPEAAQPCRDASHAIYMCGEVATAHLRTLIAGKPVACSQVDTDRYGRTVATCSVAGQDIGRAMVSAGHAVDYARYSHGAYANSEREARWLKRGMWAGTFTRPEEYRHAQRR